MSEYARRATGSFTAAGGKSTVGRSSIKSRTMSGPEFRKYMRDKMKRAMLRAELVNSETEKRRHLTEAVKIGRMLKTMDEIWPITTDSRAAAPVRR